MKNPEKRTIEFSVDRVKRVEIDVYAEIKGLGSASNLARLATFQYMERHKLTPRQKAAIEREFSLVSLDAGNAGGSGSVQHSASRGENGEPPRRDLRRSGSS